MPLNIKSVFIILYLCFTTSTESWEEVFDKDQELDLDNLVRTMGFDGIEVHTQTSIDGYTLTIERIKQDRAHAMIPVIFAHGLTGCAETFFMQKENSMPAVLARNGFDVWLLNARGTAKSSNHTKWNSKTDREFWMFSWQEIGLIDLPIAIDLVLKHNIHKKTNLIGHSEGSTVIFITLSARPEYNEKVSLSVHLGVSVYSDGCGSVSFFRDICKMEPILRPLLESVGLVSLPSLAARDGLKLFCRYDIFKQACIEASRVFFQSNEQIEHVADWSFIVTKALCGGSMRELYHYMQVGNSGRFAMFNHGTAENLKIYNSTEPPLFPLENVKSPVVLWCGKSDIFCTKGDMKKLIPQLPNVVSTTFRGQNIFSHVDFLIAKDVKYGFYDEMILLLKRYSQ